MANLKEISKGLKKSVGKAGKGINKGLKEQKKVLKKSAKRLLIL